MNEESLTGISSLYSSTFAQVIFVNVEKQYTTDVAVKCNYTLTPRITPHKNDWIGIFKVGWSTARDYHTFVWAPLPKQAGQVERQQQVTFEAYYLPKDDNDFYQFCYVTQKGEIRGASTPFGFRLANHGVPDHSEGDSSQEMLIITTQEKLEETEREKDELRENNQMLTTENTELRGKIKELETQAVREREENSAALKKAVLELEEQVREQKLKSELELKARSEKEEQLRTILTEKEVACLNVQAEKQDLLAQVESAQASLEQLKQKNEKDRDKLRQLQQENERVRAENGAKEDELASLTEVKNESEGELKAAQERLQLVQCDFETQKKENLALKEDLMKLAEVQNQQQSCLAEISQLRHALSKSEELKASNANAVEKLQEQVGNLQQCLKNMETQVQSAQQQQVQTMVELKVARASQEQSQKSLCEAQQEIQHWKSKFEKVDEIFSKNEACTEATISADHPVQKELASLKAKLLTGKSCYVQKYKECQKLHKQINKLKALLEDKSKCHCPIKEGAGITEIAETGREMEGAFLLSVEPIYNNVFQNITSKKRISNICHMYIKCANNQHSLRMWPQLTNPNPVGTQMWAETRAPGGNSRSHSESIQTEPGSPVLKSLGLTARPSKASLSKAGIL
ncbi:tax1-binding protein 1 homolog B-like isoform X2 [Mobula hypostoma]|uniref:tax1-binding protein 1 homolog B-like isoform X2 n=1 Tax=Mobula hypostoma TaxID=723540 RepID=UPI002FC2F6FD